MNFFFDPNNNEPRPDRWIPALLGVAGAYLLYNQKSPMQEVSFQEFLNDYLITRRVAKIDIVKDQMTKSEVINHRAEITLHDGKKVYLVLYSAQQFLQKLEYVQKEMKIDMSQWIPVSFTKSGEDLNGSSPIANIIIGTFFLAVLYQLFKGNKKGGSGAATGKKIKKGDRAKDDKKGGFFGGGGGMNDMFGMSKSNA